MRPTIALDVDGVLADYRDGWKGIDHIGDPIPGAVEFTRRLAETADILIYTTRCCEEIQGRNGAKAHLLRKIVQEWLDKHGFVYHEIWTGQGKPIFSAVIDDRAVTCRPQSGGPGYEVAMEEVRDLLRPRDRR